MSNAERDDAIGKTYAEKRELEKTIALLTGEARRFGADLERLGRWLQSNPEKIVFEGMSFPAEDRDTMEFFDGKAYPDVEQLKKLTKSLRDNLQRLAVVEAELDKV
jgi:hypothetical protein